jgi:hypothetical protein
LALRVASADLGYQQLQILNEHIIPPAIKVKPLSLHFGVDVIGLEGKRKP